MKYYNNIKVLATPSEDNDVITKKFLDDETTTIKNNIQTVSDSVDEVNNNLNTHENNTEIHTTQTEKDSYALKEKITDVIEETSTSDDIASAKGVYKKLYKTVTETIVDVPEHYELSTDGTGLTIVDDDAVPVSTEIRISDVNAKLLESDEHNYAIGEVVKLVAEVNHQEDREKEIYAKREDIPESSTTMSIQEFNEMWGEVTVIS